MNLPDTFLAKKALLENIALRSNWILTIEKLINTFNLADKIGNHQKFKKAAKQAMEDAFKVFWTKSLENPNLSRLIFYKKIKTEFKIEGYLDVVTFENRRSIAKLRCSDHALGIEKGRHKQIPKPNRTCRLCKTGMIEDEEHFLFVCSTFDFLRLKYKYENYTLQEFFNNTNYEKVGKFLTEAFTIRDNTIKSSR